jgi:PAS domain S-box-containing protein
LWYNCQRAKDGDLELVWSDAAVNADPLLIDRAARNLADGLVLIDAQARVAFWNLRAQTLLGWSADEMLGHSTDELVDCLALRTEMPDTTRSQLPTTLTARQPDRAVELELRLDGSEHKTNSRFISLRCFPLMDDERNLGIGILLRDVTPERTADAMKSQLLSTVSHELRTPLASIKGFATTLLRQVVQWDEATQRDFLRIIEEESDRLTEIIDNLLDMSQIEAGALRIAPEPTQLRKLIREVVDEMRMRTEAHYFVVDLPAEMPRVLADARRIRQVLTNLIGNAIKYSKHGQITVACEMQAAHVTVSVADQGQGISPRFIDKIFDRFFQIDGASTRRVGGSGLGLAISRGIVEAHNGRMWVESIQGQGSTFRFTLPLIGDEGAGSK